MKSTTQSMARTIGDALERKGAPRSLGRITVEEMAGQSRRIMTPCIVVRNEGSAMPHVFDLQVDREALPPGIADEIATRLIETAGDPVRNAEHSALQAMLAPFTALLPQPSTIAFDAPDFGNCSQFSLFCHALDHTLVRGLQRFTAIHTGTANNIVKRAHSCETHRASLLEKAGASRRDALLCCPVAERAMAATPDDWRSKVEEAIAGKTGTSGFLDGVYRPMIHFGGGVRWRQSTLMIDMEMPETVRSALPGRPLSDVFRHPLIPDGITVTGTAQRIGDGEVYVRTDAEPVPLRSVLDALGVAA